MKLPDPAHPDSDQLRLAAQVVRIFDRVQMDNLVDIRIDVTPDDSQRDGVLYMLHIEGVKRLTRAQYIAIVTPNDLQLLRAEDVVDWPSSLVHEYRRQYGERMRQPNPPLLIHPDHAEQVWVAANGPLPERTI
jgi:hypothetical protein